MTWSWGENRLLIPTNRNRDVRTKTFYGIAETIGIVNLPRIMHIKCYRWSVEMSILILVCVCLWYIDKKRLANNRNRACIWHDCMPNQMDLIIDIIRKKWTNKQKFYRLLGKNDNITLKYVHISWNQCFN